MIRTAVEERRTQNPLLSWWETSTLPALEVLPSTATLVGLRTALVNSFVASVEPAGISRFVAAGMAATWWEDSTFDLKAAASRGWKAVLEGWLTTAEASQDDKNAPDLADTLAIRILAGEHLASRATLAIEATRLDAEVKAAEVTESDEEGEDEDRDNAISPAELKKLKADRTKAKKALPTNRDTGPNQHPLGDAATSAQPHRLRPGTRTCPSFRAEPHAGVLGYRRAVDARLRGTKSLTRLDRQKRLARPDVACRRLRKCDSSSCEISKLENA